MEPADDTASQAQRLTILRDQIQRSAIDFANFRAKARLGLQNMAALYDAAWMTFPAVTTAPPASLGDLPNNLNRPTCLADLPDGLNSPFLSGQPPW